MHAMTGSWLIAKWIGISIAVAYWVLVVIVYVRFRNDLSRLRRWLILPAVLGGFVLNAVPSVFEDVTVTRICFIAGSGIFAGGTAVLLRGLYQEGHKALFRESGAGDYVQPLKFN